MATSDHKGAQRSLEQAINVQRAKLISAHAVQQCLYEALLYADSEDAVMYAEVRQLVATLLKDVLDKLDAAQLRTVVSEEGEAGELSS